MKPPRSIRNVPEWEHHCLRIHRTAVDLLQGRSGVIETARALAALASSAHLTDDEDLLTFVGIDSETDTFPIGQVRKYWDAIALAREDAKFREAEELYRSVAMQAGSRLEQRFRWAIDAEVQHRRQGGAAIE